MTLVDGKWRAEIASITGRVVTLSLRADVYMVQMGDFVRFVGPNGLRLPRHLYRVMAVADQEGYVMVGDVPPCACSGDWLEIVETGP